MALTIERAVEEVLKEGKVKSLDFGGRASTREVGEEIIKKLKYSF